MRRDHVVKLSCLGTRGVSLEPIAVVADALGGRTARNQTGRGSGACGMSDIAQGRSVATGVVVFNPEGKVKRWPSPRGRTRCGQ